MARRPPETCAYQRQGTFRCILPKGHTQPCAGYLPNDSLWTRVHLADKEKRP